METGPRLKVSSDRLVKPRIEPATPGLQGKRYIHYTTAAPTYANTQASYFPKFYHIWALTQDNLSLGFGYNKGADHPQSLIRAFTP